MYTMLCKYGKRMRKFRQSFCICFSLFFFILWAFQIKQLFHLHLLDMKWLYQTRHYTAHWLSAISYFRQKGQMKAFSRQIEFSVGCVSSSLDTPQ